MLPEEGRPRLRELEAHTQGRASYPLIPGMNRPGREESPILKDEVIREVLAGFAQDAAAKMLDLCGYPRDRHIRLASSRHTASVTCLALSHAHVLLRSGSGA